jgi:hypothetical protein
MFEPNDPQFLLDLYRQRAAEWQREAAAHHLAVEASAAGRHRHAWWHRHRPVRLPVAS